MKLVMAIVNYNSLSATKNMLLSANNLQIKPDIYVLDNGNTIDLSEKGKLGDYYTGLLQVVNLPKNYGYFGAVSTFLSMHKGLYFDWLFIANSDLVFIDPCVFNYLEDYTNGSNMDVGIYCPSIISAKTKIDQNPFLWNKPSKYYFYKYKASTSSYYLAKTYNRLSDIKTCLKKNMTNKRKTIKRAYEVFAPHGAFVGLNSIFFNRGGYIESRNFLYCEEEILGFICKRINLKVIYDARARVLHDEHIVTGSAYTKTKHAIRKKSFDILKEYIL